VIACKDEESEADFVIDTILNMAATEEIGPNETIAVVYRTNAQSRHLEEACVAKNVPYIIRGGAGGFYKRAEIKDCLCFLRWLYNGNDEGSMLRAFKTPSKGIGEKAVEEFRKYCELVQTYYREYYPLSRRPTPLDVLISMTDDDALGESDSAMPSGAPQAADHISKRAFNNFLAFSLKMRDFRAHAYEMKVDELLFYIIEELNLMDHFNSISKSNSEFKERQENVQELRQAAKKYASSGTALNHRVPSSKDEAMGDQSALAIFLDDVALVSDVTESESQEMYGDRMVVNLMTIHASKGTEFDCVFVVGLEEGTLPCQPALQETENPVQLEEERRLCYVAMTRAKTHLILTWRREVTIFSDWSASGPKTVTKRRSRFLDALVSTKSKEDGAGREQKKTSDQRNVVSGSKRQISSSSNSGVGRHGLQGTNGSRKPNLVGERRYMDEAVKVQTGRKAWEQIRTNKKLSSSESNPLRKKKDVKRTPSSGPGTVSKKPSPDFDPTWFFPVGEVVLHRSLGKGVVLEHLPYSKIEEAEVSVQFENGKVCNFPALGSDIIPDLGTSRPR
jgi:DNA helicase-2/ATP-dependent DNA helicase PcrA